MLLKSFNSNPNSFSETRIGRRLAFGTVEPLILPKGWATPLGDGNCWGLMP